MAYLPSLPDHASLLDVFRMFPETSEPLLSFHEVLLRGPSPFTEAERELIAAYVSGLNGCRYCHGVHAATAERLGVAPGTITGLLKGDKSTIPHKMVPVLDFAKKLNVQKKHDGLQKVLTVGPRIFRRAVLFSHYSGVDKRMRYYELAKV